MNKLLELAARCEAATSSDAVLDSAIARAVGQDVPAMRYTISLDTAMLLVPEGRAVELALVPGGHSHAAVILAEPETWAKGFAVSGALALCAASLRARRAITEGQSDE